MGGAFVKIGFFRDAAELVYHDEVNGDLFTQARQTLDLLLTKYLKAAVGYQDIVRVERFPVPREALREAVLNALVHRDYMVPAPVQIRVYDDKLVLWNPAVLPEGWTAQTLLQPHSFATAQPRRGQRLLPCGRDRGLGARHRAHLHRLAGRPACPSRLLRLEAGGLWMTFAFDEAYLRVVRGSGGCGRAGQPASHRPSHRPESPTQSISFCVGAARWARCRPANCWRRSSLKHRQSFRTN